MTVLRSVQRFKQGTSEYVRFLEAVLTLTEKKFGDRAAEATALVECIAGRRGRSTAILALQKARTVEELEDSGNKLARTDSSIPFVRAEAVDSGPVDYEKRMKDVRDQIRYLADNATKAEQTNADFETVRAVLLFLKKKTDMLDYLRDADEKLINWQVLEQFFDLGDDHTMRLSFDLISTNSGIRVATAITRSRAAFVEVAEFVEKYGEVALALYPVLTNLEPTQSASIPQNPA